MRTRRADPRRRLGLRAARCVGSADSDSITRVHPHVALAATCAAAAAAAGVVPVRAKPAQGGAADPPPGHVGALCLTSMPAGHGASGCWSRRQWLLVTASVAIGHGFKSHRQLILMKYLILMMYLMLMK